ncbi:MAG: ATPase, T2SS/T4P/T4SS family [Patescibacteria group bacterium]
MHAEEGQLLNFLIDSGLISRSQLDALYAGEDDRPLATILVERGLLSEDEVRRATATALGIPFIILSHDDIDPEALELIPEPLARNRNVIAYRTQDDAVQVALLDMQDLQAVEFLRPRMRVTPRLTNRDSLRRGLLLYQKQLKKKFGLAIARDVQAIVEPAPGASEELLRYSAERLPVVYVTDSLVRHALHQKASHVHLEWGEEGLTVRYRIAGVMHDAMLLPRHAAHPVLLRLKLLAGLILKSTEPQEGRFKLKIDDDVYSVRASTLPTITGEKIVLRIMSEQSRARGFTLESLGFHGMQLEYVHAALLKHKGLVLVAGPAGSGKTTTLYTLLDLLHNPHLSISTIEDSIEMRLPYAAQTAINPAIGLTPSMALRAALRLDPDVVVISELRDADTALLALQAANSGKLILAGINAGTAALAVETLAALAPRKLIAPSLLLVIAGRLVKKMCGTYRSSYKISRAESNLLEPYADFGRVLAALKDEKVIDKQLPWKEVLFESAEGCKECVGGYQGMLGIHEVMPVSAAIARLIEEGEPVEAVDEQARSEEVLTLVADGIFKAALHQTSLEEIVRVVAQD